MTTGNSPTSRSVITVVYVAKVYLSDGKIGIVFRDVAPDGRLVSERVYQYKRFQHLRVGAVYEVEIDSADQRSIYTNTFRWLRLWENIEEAATWQLAADAFDSRHLAAQQEKKQNARKLPVELLAPIRREYWRTNYAGRLAIEIRVLSYLRQVTITSSDQR